MARTEDELATPDVNEERVAVRSIAWLGRIIVGGWSILLALFLVPQSALPQHRASVRG